MQATFNPTASAGWRSPPWGVLFCIVGLLLIGVSGISRGDALEGGTRFHERQLVWITLGLPLIALCAAVNYRTLARWSGWLYGINLLLLVVVYFIPPINGSQRWIPLGFFSFQPSETTKIVYILALADYLRHRDNYRKLSGLWIPFLMTIIPLGLILREPDLGTSLLFLPLLFALLFAAGARPGQLLGLILLGICLLPALWMFMSAEQKSRVTTVFTQRDGGAPPTGEGYHLHQSKQVLALGGVWGSEWQGMAIDDPSAYHLPAGQTDFVFCMVGERWGLLGCLVTMALYLWLFGQGLWIAARCRDPFGRMLAVGVVTLLATQTIVNSGMTVGLMPVTGLTLPLVSYGGSSLLTTCVALGLLISVHLRDSYELTGRGILFGEA